MATTSRRSPRSTGASRTPSAAARPRSTRTFRSIAASPTPPAMRSSSAFWTISAASSFRARASARASTRIEDQRAYLKRIQNEHMEILDAIRAGAAATARAAMRRHLVDSRKRYQKLVAEIGDGPAAAAASS